MILKGDCVEVMKAIKPNSIDAVICDPPYGLEFMGKEWDKNLNHNLWTIEAFRILKPGGSMFAMGGTRTFHRLMVAIEDSGFILKDTLMWLYGSGFPKTQDLGKMIDKREGVEREVIGKIKTNLTAYQRIGDKNICGDINITAPSSNLAKKWDGFKIGGIKPAYEPIVWAVKPPEGSYTDNVLKYGVGAVNVDETRVGTDEDTRRVKGGWQDDGYVTGKYDPEKYNAFEEREQQGRFPANIILDETTSKMGEWTRFFYTAKASRFERNEGLRGIGKTSERPSGVLYNEKEKAFSQEKLNQNVHPTVKPISLFEWLIKLVTRKGQIVLDPFLGSGTALLACKKSGRKCIGIERESEYIEIAKERIKNFSYQETLLS